MRPFVCLLLVLPACLPSAFDAADRREHAREVDAKAHQSQNADTARDAGTDSDSGRTSASAAGSRSAAGRGAAGLDAAGRGAPTAGNTASGDDSDGGAPPVAGAAAANGGSSDAGHAGAGAAGNGASGAAGRNESGTSGSGRAGAGGASPCGDTSSDAKNCGTCGNDCSASSALVSCAASSCMRACLSTHADCNSDLQFGSQGDGCETSIADDANNCGGCNQRCDRGDGTVPTCSARACRAITANVSSPTPVTEAAHGPGAGGMEFQQLCGRNSVLIGIDAAADSEVLYGFAAVCAPVQLRGAPEDLELYLGEPASFPLLGNGFTMQPVARMLCPSGAAVTSVSGTIWNYMPDPQLITIKQLVLRCAQIDVDENRNLTFGPSAIVTAGSAPNSTEAFDDPCPGDQVVAGFSGHAGYLIDQIQTFCAGISLADLPTTSRVVTPGEAP